MDFLDQKVLEYRRNARKSGYSTLETGMYINDELVTFERIGLFDQKVSIMLPQTFVDLPSNMAKVKYPSEQRPQIIKTSLDTAVNFAFSLLDMPLQKEDIASAIKQFQEMIKKVNPAYIFYDIKTDITEETGKGWFDFKSYALDEQMYNIMYIMPIKGQMLHGIFNCKYRDILEWKDAALQVIDSVSEWDETLIIADKGEE